MSSPDDFKTADKMLPKMLPTPYDEGHYEKIPDKVVDWRTLPDWKSNEFRCRLLGNAVPEAAKYRRDVCNQGCSKHLYFPPDGLPHEQVGGLVHECPVITIVFMCEAHWDMIRIGKIEGCPIADIPRVIEAQRKKNRLYDAAWYYWKKARKVPKIRDIENGKYLGMVQ